MKKSIFLVSHSVQITDGIKAMIQQMSQTDQVAIYSLGGTADGDLGSDPMKIIAAVEMAEDSDVIFVFADLGSAVLSSELAYEMLAEKEQQKYVLVDAPLVEGAFAAAITAAVSDDVAQIIAEAQGAGQKGWTA